MNIIPAFVRHRIAQRTNLVKIIDNIGWLFFDKVLRMGVVLLVGVWVARYLGPEQFGLFSFATAFVGMFGAVAGLGLQSIVVRDIVFDSACKEETLGTAIGLQLLGGMIAYACVMGTIFWLRPEAILAKIMVAILGSLLLFKFSEVALYWFESQVMSKYIVWVQTPCFLAFAAIKVCLILSQAELQAFAWATVSEAFMVAVLILSMLGLRGPKLKQLRFSLQRAKTLMMDSWPLLLSCIVNALYMKIDQIMLGQMVGDDSVGIYSAAVRISEVWYFVPAMIAASVFPSILEAKKRDDAEYQQRLQFLYDLMVWLSFAIALPMTFLSTPIVVALYGPAYAESGSILAIHIWSSVFVFLGVASGQWFISERRPMLGFQRSFLGLAINVCLNFILIPKFGAIGTAVSTLLGQIAAGWLFDLVQPVTRPAFIAKSKSFNLIRSYKVIIKIFKK